VIERLKGKPRGECTVTDDCDDAATLAAALCSHCHAKRRTDRSAGMTDAEGVVFAFAACWERRKPAILLDSVQLVTAAGQNLVRIRLVADVPDQAVMRCIEHVMQGNRQLDRAEPCGKMTAARGDAMDQEPAQFLCQGGKFRHRQAPQVCG